MGLALWKRHSRNAIAVKGVFELREMGLHFLQNQRHREEDWEAFEAALVLVYGEDALMSLFSIREQVSRDPLVRDMTAVLYGDNVVTLHLFALPTDRLESGLQMRLRASVSSISIYNLDKALDFFTSLVNYLLVPLEEYYWEDYDPVTQVQFNIVYKED